MRVIVCRKAHAAWVDNELSLSGANGARNMCVAAGNKWRTLSPKSEFYFFRAGGPDTADLYCFQKPYRWTACHGTKTLPLSAKCSAEAIGARQTLWQ